MQNGDLIKYAESLLANEAIDTGHGLDHHRRVYELAREISSAEELKIDLDTLKLACYYHDVRSDEGESADLFRNKAKEYQLSERIVTEVVKAIEAHPMDKRPRSSYGKLLFDADKLDALSFERLRKIARSIENRELSPRRKATYLRVGKLWLKVMKSRLHYRFSKLEYDRRLRELLSSDELIQRAQNLDIDLSEIRQIAELSPGIFQKMYVAAINLAIDLKGITR